jgi:predicted NAD/FAD-binding protein
MGFAWTRRDVLRTVVTAAGAPLLAGTGAAARRRVGIVGGGMAGISLAWLLDGARDVVLLEARETLGGNVQSVEIELDGHRIVVDMGAQFFHPGPYPIYTRLLTHLGLYPPGPAAPSHAFPASITVTAEGEALPRFVSPSLPERWWPLFAPWNQAGVAAFGWAFAAARWREQLRGAWSLTLDDWLQTLGLTSQQREGMLLPWAASLFSGSIEQARGLSARAAMIFAAKALPENPFDPVVYYVLRNGMAEALNIMLGQCTTLEVMTRAVVGHVTRGAPGGFTIHCSDGRAVAVDDLVLASSGPASLQILNTLPGTEAQRRALHAIEFHDAQLALHTDPIYAPSNPLLWSFLNCHARGGFCEASMWLAPVIGAPGGPPPATTAKLWKSWITHRDRMPRRILHQVSFKHMLPTPETLRAQLALRRLQGRDGIWFAGGYMRPYDAQETALLAAIGVALGLHITTPRAQTLSAAIR